VTGAGGFLGKRVVERLLAHGHGEIRGLLRNIAKGQGLLEIAEAYPDAELELVSGNLKSSADCARVVKDVDIVIHLAAAMKGGAADMFMDSVVGSRNLLDAIRLNPRTRVVLVSSFGVYGTAESPRNAVLDESFPLERHPEKRDVYSYTKLRQEQLFWEYREKYNIDLVVCRPGVIYGPGGGHFSSRIGLNLFGLFLHIGGSNRLPLSYVDNCAEAIVTAALSPDSSGQAYNIHDDEIPTCRRYLREYKKNVRKVRSLYMPYLAVMAMSKCVEWYHAYSKGQLPAVFTRYKSKSAWGGNRFTNAKLRSLGWTQLVSTAEGMRRTFASFRAELNGDANG
jgi:nucleoside-diphosphate-sugar epimerase